MVFHVICQAVLEARNASGFVAQHVMTVAVREPHSWTGPHTHHHLSLTCPRGVQGVRRSNQTHFHQVWVAVSELLELIVVADVEVLDAILAVVDISVEEV
jgi:hypothetical protein